MAHKQDPIRLIPGGDGVGCWLNTQAMAWLLGITPQALNLWAGSRGCPKEALDTWDPRKVLAWRLRTEADGDDEAAALGIRSATAVASFREVRAQRERLVTDLLAGKYMDSAEVAHQWHLRVGEIRWALAALVRQIAGNFSDLATRRAVQAVATREAQDMLAQYSRDGLYTPAGKARPSPSG